MDSIWLIFKLGKYGSINHASWPSLAASNLHQLTTTSGSLQYYTHLYTGLAKDREIPEFGIVSHSVNPLSEVGAGLQGSFHLGGVHGLVLGQVLLHSMGDKTQKQEKCCPCGGKTR